MTDRNQLRRSLAIMLVSALFAVAIQAGCSDTQPTSTGQQGRTGQDADSGLTLTSPDFSHGRTFPQYGTYEGKNYNPPLKWSGVPEGTRQFALILEDPDAPSNTPWVHWVAYNIPADVREIPSCTSSVVCGESPENFVDGVNSWPAEGDFYPNNGYRGPEPPAGPPHRYFFRLYALDAPLDLPAGATADQLRAAMDGHILATAELMATFQRPDPN